MPACTPRPPLPPPGPVRASDRVEALLATLTVEEKASLTLGSGPWHTVALPDHGVGRVKVTDGPTGARGDARSGARATCFPVGVALGASWSTELVAEVGAALAGEARTKGAHVLLGPTVNLQRTPIGGRNFECYSEDPLLTARLAVAFIGGVQDGGVGTSIKHFVGNDVEHDRHHVSAEMDERTLREVALLPFELAVREADPWTVMAAYNRVDGVHATASRRLLTEILKDEWGWRGAVVSDWGGGDRDGGHRRGRLRPGDAGPRRLAGGRAWQRRSRRAGSVRTCSKRRPAGSSTWPSEPVASTTRTTPPSARSTRPSCGP